MNRYIIRSVITRIIFSTGLSRKKSQ
jgi:hypothetical protein